MSRKFKVCVHGPKYLVISKYFSITFQVLSHVKIDNASGGKEDVLNVTQTLIQRSQHIVITVLLVGHTCHSSQCKQIHTN